ncbi:MAG: XRE family transcriptional regulator [Bacteroidetes bacterium]|nr:MAG: XRE family transcriptional regulator [Bacteroidota bacterium]
MSDKGNIYYGETDAAILQRMGRALKKMRLEANLKQEELAEAAGINRSTLSQIENGSGTTLLTLVQLLRALNRLELLADFDDKPELSPMQVAEAELKMRKRVRKDTTNPTEESEW